MRDIRQMACLLRHKWSKPWLDGPYDVGPVMAIWLGNGFHMKRCQRCGKVKQTPVFIRTPQP